VVGVDLEVEIDEVGEGVRKAWRRELVPDLPAFSSGPHEAAPAQAAEVIRDVRAARAQRLGEFGGIRRTIEQCQKDSPPGRIGQRGPDPVERVGGRRRLHAHDDTVISESSTT